MIFPRSASNGRKRQALQLWCHQSKISQMEHQHGSVIEQLPRSEFEGRTWKKLELIQLLYTSSTALGGYPVDTLIGQANVVYLASPGDIAAEVVETVVVHLACTHLKWRKMGSNSPGEHKDYFWHRLLTDENISFEGTREDIIKSINKTSKN